MPKVIQMPSEDELPPGARRRFMEALYRLWIDAGRPASLKVSERIAESDLAGSASKEAVRRMLSGKAVPQDWHNAEAVFVVLSEMAGLDPDRLVIVDSDHEYGEVEFGPGPARAAFQKIWSEARGGGVFLHEPMTDYIPPAKKDDPWATGGFGNAFGGDAGSAKDELPF
ncbi:hypothetical protein ACQEU5_25205 [Marinactinospora thermotolerans]|uniref:hypothetical protein n=1 Tax=Marinactinospora thermotolerans TaxID=531310 RepID=UPI003D8E517A